MVNQRKLATKLKLSQAAVSKALKGSADISEKTRARVLAAAAESGYHPNPLARALNGGRTGMVGILTRRYTGYFFIRLQMALFQELEAHNLVPLVSLAGATEAENGKALGALSRYRPEGMVVFQPWPEWTHPQLTELSASGMPVVSLAKGAIPGLCNVLSAEREAARELTEHLLSLGHRHIAYWGASSEDGPLAARGEGYVEALERAGLSWQSALRIPHVASLERVAMEEAVVAYMHEHPETTAIFCEVDDMALAAIGALRRSGYRIPEDLSITGFGDNLKYPNDMALPPTTVSHQPEQLAKLAVRLLTQGIAGEKIAGDNWVYCKIVHRASVASPSKERKLK